MDLSPLDRALMAARRGHTVAARSLLDDVLAFEPQNEEALLWRARVAETDAERADHLQRALAVNPENRWAAEQLDGLDTDGAGSGGAAAASGTADTLSCPNCGGSVEIHPERGSKAVACTYCGSVLDLSTSQLDILGQMNPKVGPRQPVKPGDEAVFFDEPHLVIGWLKYEGWDDEDRWDWEEWQLVSDSGVPRYLSYSFDEGWTIQTPIRPTPQVGRGGIKLKEGRAGAKETSPARITAMQGELTWRPKLGQTLQVMEARRGDQHYSVELTADEIEVVGGPRISERELWEAFGRDDKIAEMDARIEAARARRKRLRGSAIIALLAAALYFMGIGWAESKGTDIYTGSADFVATQRGAPRPEPPGPNLRAVVGERLEIGTFTVSDPGTVHDLTLRVDLPPGQSRRVSAYVQIEEPGGPLRQLTQVENLSADGAHSEAFKPTKTGPHALYAFVEDSSPDRFTFRATVKKGAWQGGPFAGACGMAVLLALVLFLAGGFGKVK